ncbi:SIR2 family protein [Mycolicibacterium sp. P1-18]|nr:SIR2 family protein [Mycolicibacterium sp. P1-18]
MSGHLFIINGDLNQVACDAVLIPTDGTVHITDSWNLIMRGKRAPRSFGRKLVVHIRSESGHPQIWLGNVGQAGSQSDFELFKPTVREFVKQAVEQLRTVDDGDRIYPWPRRRLGVNIVGSGDGGGSDKKGELIEGLVETLNGLVVEYDVDIVLVAFGEKPYAATQRARRRLVGDDTRIAYYWDFDDLASKNLVAQAQRLAKAAIDNQLVLFIGAGVSAGAGLPTWSKLLSDLAVTASMNSDVSKALSKKDLRDQATVLERRLLLAGLKLREVVAAQLDRPGRYALQHGLLASLSSKEAVTTNFDNMFESAARICGRGLAVLPASPSETDGRWLLKLHGSVCEPEKIVLSRSDFLEMPRQYGALMGLVQGLLLMRHMMFVGYSLQDEDFHEVVHEVRAARGGPAADGGRGTVLTLFHDQLEQELWADDLEVVPMLAIPYREDLLAEAARQLELFLDLVGYLSTTSAPFFLDSTYSSLSQEECELRGLLTNLVDLTRRSPVDSVGYIVSKFLSDLGSDTA